MRLGAEGLSGVRFALVAPELGGKYVWSALDLCLNGVRLPVFDELFLMDNYRMDFDDWRRLCANPAEIDLDPLFVSRACQLCRDATFGMPGDVARDMLAEMLGVPLSHVHPDFAAREAGILDLHQQSGSRAGALLYVCVWKPRAWLCSLGTRESTFLAQIDPTDFLAAVDELDRAIIELKERGTET